MTNVTETIMVAKLSFHYKVSILTSGEVKQAKHWLISNTFQSKDN